MTVTEHAYEQDGPTVDLPAYADYHLYQYYAMYIHTDGRARICAANAEMYGVLQTKPTAQDELCTVRKRGIAMGVLGYAVSAGNSVSTRSDGTFGPQSSTNAKVGVAMRGGAAGDVIPIDLDKAGGPSVGTVAAPPGVMEFRIPLASITTDADLKTGIKVPSAGTIVDMQVDVDVVDNLTGKTAILYLKIGTTAVTGAEVTITSATLTPVLTTLNSAAAASANNTFVGSDTLKISAKTVTSFAGSTGWITVRILTSS